LAWGDDRNLISSPELEPHPAADDGALSTRLTRMTTRPDRNAAERGARVRLDSWLWAARFFKTRSLAAQAIDGGRVHVNGERGKRSKLVQAGDRIELRQGPFRHELVVRGVADRRGPAEQAAALYLESAESRAEREALRHRLKATAPLFRDGAGRPTKQERRAIERLRGRRR
jgi:ribosome-associated heat shock protein Hsp15